jgi:thiamine biosynthesis lipoprotein
MNYGKLLMQVKPGISKPLAHSTLPQAPYKCVKAAGKNRLLPSDMEIKRGLKNMGVDKIVLEGSGTNLLKKAEVSIDLGGLGKGYTADNIITLIKGHGETSALVAMSGDIRALGHRPDGKPWRVGIQDPRFPENPDCL